MITTLSIKNFQAHRKLLVKLSPTVTSIVGDSDIGKSALYRALRWLATNKPLGDAFIHRTKAGRSKICSVSLWVDGKRVTRTKGATNSYKVGKLLLKAFGAEPPKEVLDLLNLSPLNFQSQHDAPFWFAKSAGEVSRELNSIIDLSVIDSTLSNLAHRARQTRSESDIASKRLEGARSVRRLHRCAKDASEQLEALTAREKALGRLSKRVEKLTVLVGKATHAQTTHSNLSQVIQEGVAVCDRWVQFDAANRQVASLGDLLAKAVHARKKIKLEVPDMRRLETMQQALDIAEKTIATVGTLLYTINTTEQKVAQLQVDADTAWAKFRSASMGTVCPVCSRPMDDQTLDIPF